MSSEVYKEFSVGNIFRTGFDVVNKNLLPFLGMALILAIAVLAITFVSTAFLGISMASFSGADSIFTIIIAIGIAFVYAYIFVFYLSYVVRKSLTSLNELNTSVGATGQAYNTETIPLIGLAIIMGIAIGIGFLLLIIPGIILMLMFYLAFPIKIAEGRSAIESLKRSMDLTQGYRIKILAIIVVPIIIFYILNIVLMIIPIIGFILSILLSIYYYAYTYSLYAVVYQRIIEEKEGGNVEEIGSVFT